MKSLEIIAIAFERDDGQITVQTVDGIIYSLFPAGTVTSIADIRDGRDEVLMTVAVFREPQVICGEANGD